MRGFRSKNAHSSPQVAFAVLLSGDSITSTVASTSEDLRRGSNQVSGNSNIRGSLRPSTKRYKAPSPPRHPLPSVLRGTPFEEVTTASSDLPARPRTSNATFPNSPNDSPLPRRPPSGERKRSLQSSSPMVRTRNPQNTITKSSPLPIQRRPMDPATPPNPKYGNVIYTEENKTYTLPRRPKKQPMSLSHQADSPETSTAKQPSMDAQRNFNPFDSEDDLEPQEEPPFEAAAQVRPNHRRSMSHQEEIIRPRADSFSSLKVEVTPRRSRGSSSSDRDFVRPGEEWLARQKAEAPRRNSAGKSGRKEAISQSVPSTPFLKKRKPAPSNPFQSSSNEKIVKSNPFESLAPEGELGHQSPSWSSSHEELTDNGPHTLKIHELIEQMKAWYQAGESKDITKSSDLDKLISSGSASESTSSMEHTDLTLVTPPVNLLSNHLTANAQKPEVEPRSNQGPTASKADSPQTLESMRVKKSSRTEFRPFSFLNPEETSADPQSSGSQLLPQAEDEGLVELRYPLKGPPKPRRTFTYSPEPRDNVEENAIGSNRSSLEGQREPKTTHQEDHAVAKRGTLEGRREIAVPRLTATRRLSEVVSSPKQLRKVFSKAFGSFRRKGSKSKSKSKTGDGSESVQTPSCFRTPRSIDQETVYTKADGKTPSQQAPSSYRPSIVIKPWKDSQESIVMTGRRDSQHAVSQDLELSSEEEEMNEIFRKLERAKLVMIPQGVTQEEGEDDGSVKIPEGVDEVDGPEPSAAGPSTSGAEAEPSVETASKLFETELQKRRRESENMTSHESLDAALEELIRPFKIPKRNLSVFRDYGMPLALILPEPMDRDRFSSDEEGCQRKYWCIRWIQPGFYNLPEDLLIFIDRCLKRRVHWPRSEEVPTHPYLIKNEKTQPLAVLTSDCYILLPGEGTVKFDGLESWLAEAPVGNPPRNPKTKSLYNSEYVRGSLTASILSLKSITKNSAAQELAVELEKVKEIFNEFRPLLFSLPNLKSYMENHDRQLMSEAERCVRFYQCHKRLLAQADLIKMNPILETFISLYTQFYNEFWKEFIEPSQFDPRLTRAQVIEFLETHHTYE